MNYFFDIETVTQEENYVLLDEGMQAEWRKIADHKYSDLSYEESYFKYGPLYPEFGRIVCISLGHWLNNDALSEEKPERNMMTFSGDEKEILIEFTNYLNALSVAPVLVGHRIKFFDIPYIFIRMLAYQLTVPSYLILYGQKPWEVQHMDTWEMWKSGNYTTTQAASLPAMCMVLGIETSKDGIDGSQVNKMFWVGAPSTAGNDRAKGLQIICQYCEKDVLANWQCYEKYCELTINAK